MVSLRFEKETDANTGASQPLHDRAKRSTMRLQVPAVIGSQRVGRIGNERALRRSRSFDQLDERRRGVALDVELGTRRFVDQLGELVNIERSRVASIRARMNGDATSAFAEANRGSLYDARTRPVPRIAQQCDLVEVHAEHGHVVQLDRRLGIRAIAMSVGA